MFVGLGHYVIEVKENSSAAHALFHRRGVGRMKHMYSRVLWLQDLIAAGGVKLKKIQRTQNVAEMLTHTPSAKELDVFLPLMGLRCCSDREKELVATRLYKPVPIKIESQESVELGQGRKLAGIWCWSNAALFELHLWTSGCVLAWLWEPC